MYFSFSTRSFYHFFYLIKMLWLRQHGNLQICGYFILFMWRAKVVVVRVFHYYLKFKIQNCLIRQVLHLINFILQSSYIFNSIFILIILAHSIWVPNFKTCDIIMFLLKKTILQKNIILGIITKKDVRI